MDKKIDFPIKLSKPAQRALANAGIYTIEQLVKYSEPEISKLHGIGKTTLIALKKLMKEMGVSFAD